MRLIVGLLALILLFALLVRALPSSWAIPLYVLFLAITIAFTGWERRRISARREELKRELQAERRDFDRRQKKRRSNPDEAPPELGS